MEVQTAAIVVFSPTSTTRRIVDSIVQGAGLRVSSMVDLTSPTVRERAFYPLEGDLVVIGVPVHATGIPALLLPCLRRLQGHNKPAVLVAVYGNMSPGVTLQELRTLAEAASFRVVGAASFVGEHSFSMRETPVAAGRPSQGDLRTAEAFGQQIAAKLMALDDLSSVHLYLPGSRGLLPLLKMSLPFNTSRVYAKTPALDRAYCTRCGLCTRLCPTGAIDRITLRIQEKRCLRCCCCVKRCPRHARKMVFRFNLPVPRLLAFKGKTPREPELYL